jgi:hypothetical protein
MRWLCALFILFAGAASARADSRATAEWHGLRALGLSADELRMADFVISEAMVGRWFSSVDRIEGVAAKCGNRVACHCEVARERGERYAAFGTAGRIGHSWSIELSLIDTHACTVIASALLSENLAPADVADRQRQLGTQLGTPPSAVAATAVKSERPLDHTPAIVSAVTAAQLTATQMTTLEDVFSSQPGFDIVDTNWGALPLTQGVRNTVLLVVDGIPQINNLLHLRALGRDARISMRNVERIEFVRGPGSVIWGANAFLGVVHIVTRDAKSRDGQVDAGMELSSADSQQLWVNGAQSRGDYALAVSIDAGRRSGLKTIVRDSPWAVKGVSSADAPWGNAGVTDPRADDWLDLGLKLDIGKSVTAMFKNQSSYQYHEISLYGPKLLPGQEGFYDKTWRTYALNAKHDLNDSLTVTANASRFEFYSWESFAFQPPYPGAVPTDDIAVRAGQRSLQGNPDKARVTHQVELRLSQFSGYEQEGWKNQLLAGIAGLDMGSPVNYASLVGVDEMPAKPNVDFGAKNRRSVSLFGIDEWSPYTWMVLAAGARYRIEAPLDATDEVKMGANVQGAFVLAGDTAGAKLVYSEGYRVPDGNSLFSTSGVKGNSELVAERSRELAAEAHAEVVPGITGSVGANITRLSNLINTSIIENDPIFTRLPENSGETDIASGYGELKWESELVDATVRYGLTGLRESKPTGAGIPYAPHNLFGTLVVRPARDISVFARSTAASHRIVEEMVPGGSRLTTLPWAVRLALGGTFANVLSGFDFDLRIENPFNWKRRMPYDLTGSATFVEDRTGSEVFATLRWNH